MDVLLDTHAFLWYFQDSEQLSAEAAEILEDTSNTLFLSIASLWELAIKVGLGKLELQKPFHELQEVLHQLAIQILPITFADTECYLDLPLHHRDPFDRMLIAQAMTHSLVIISQDKQFDAYATKRVWA
ncbi:MAG: type II toxin-antitoxin system VapC family toxin [Stenomitos frigidus ULC029]